MHCKKKSIPLLLCLLWTCTAISQNLKPIVQRINHEQHFCFDLSQSRYIAKALVRQSYQDSLIKALEKKTDTWAELTRHKDSIITTLDVQIDTFEALQELKALELSSHKAIVKRQKKEIRQRKLQNWILGGGLLVITGLAIVP